MSEDMEIVPTRFADLVQQVVSEAQYSVISGTTPEYAIRYKPRAGRLMAYVPHGYVRSVLNRAFGFDWDYKVLDCYSGMPFFTAEISGDTHVTVMGELTVRIRHPQTLEIVTSITKTSTGSQVMRTGMEFGDAVKGAESDALKRCGLALGIAQDLYWDDSAERTRYASTRDANTLMTIGGLLARASSDFGMVAQDVVDIMEPRHDGEMSLSHLLSYEWTDEQLEEIWKAVEEEGASRVDV
jgi:hypothetical protein